MKGFIHIYTGNGKGKTTAAIGQSIRAIGRGFKVLWIQYCKDITRNPSGEIAVLKDCGVDFLEFSPEIPLFKPQTDLKNIITECAKSLNAIEKVFNETKYSILVLDEINVAIQNKFISEETVVSVLKKKPEQVGLILTGRGFHKSIVEIADLVTEMKEIKHPFAKGIPAQKGVEF